MNNTANINPAAVNSEPVALKGKKQNPQMKTFIKILKIFIAVTVVFVVIVTAVTCLILNFAADARAREACEFLENNIICTVDYFDSGIEKKKYYSFENGYVSTEIHYIEDDAPEENRVTGNITDYNKFYKIVTYWFSKKAAVYSSTDGKDWDLLFKRALIKSSGGEYFMDIYYGYSTDEVISFRNDVLSGNVPDRDNPIGDKTENGDSSENYNTDISTEILGKAVYYHEIVIKHASGDISIPIEVGKVMDRCCKDYTIDYSPYYETRYEYIAAESIEEIENSAFAEYLGNSFIVNIRGKILYNPDVAGYYAESQDILTLIVNFDENDNCMAVGNIYISREFDICATMMAVSQAF